MYKQGHLREETREKRYTQSSNDIHKARLVITTSNERGSRAELVNDRGHAL